MGGFEKQQEVINKAEEEDEVSNEEIYKELNNVFMRGIVVFNNYHSSGECEKADCTFHNMGNSF